MIPALRSLGGDLRAAFRVLRKSPGFAAVHVGLLAAAVLVLTLSFTVYEVFFLRKAAVAAPEQIYRLVHHIPNVGWRSDKSRQALEAIAQTPVVSGYAGYSDFNDLAISDAAGPDARGPVQVRAQAVSPGFFEVLGVKLHAGRGLAPSDSGLDGDVPIVLSYRFWQRHFGGDPGAVGRSVLIGKAPARIVGITERAFQGFTLDTSADLRFPGAALDRVYPELRMTLPDFANSYEHVLRLQPGVDPQAAQAGILAAYFPAEEEVRRQSPGFDPKSWEVYKQSAFALEPAAVGDSRFRDRNSQTLIAFVAAGGLMLLLVAANLGGLWLARAARRENEIAVRLALGASRLQILRQSFGEALLLGIAASIAAIALTWQAAPLLPRILPPIRDFGWGSVQPIAADFTPNALVLAVAVLAALAGTFLLAIAPSLGVWGMEPVRALRRVRASQSWTGQRVVLCAQVAISTVIVLGALFAGATLRHLLAMNLGFELEQVATFDVKPILADYSGTQSYDLAMRSADRVAALPGVRGVAFGSGLLEGIGMVGTLYPTGHLAEPNERFNTSILSVSPGFFAVIGQAVLSGREFTPDDLERRPEQPVVINDLYAKRFFPGEDPVGKTISTPTMTASGTIEQGTVGVVGVVADAQMRSLRHDRPPIVYNLWAKPVPEPNGEDPGMAWKMYVRTEGDARSLFAPVREILRELAPAVPLTESSTLREQRDISAWVDALAATLGGAYSVFALLIAGIGIFSLMARMVAARTREIGIRMALGAQARDVVSLVTRQLSWVVVGGFIAGVAGAWALLQKAGNLFVGVSPTDPRIAFVGLLLILAMAAAAAWLPARRATHMQPVEALREE